MLNEDNTEYNMGLGHNTTIVRSGLVFYYDMSNTQKSFRGEPTTNLYDFGYYQAEGGHTAVRTAGDAPGLSTSVVDYHTITTTTSWVSESARLIIWPATTLAASTTFRVSFWARVTSKGSTTIRSAFYGNNTNNSHSLTTTWQRFSYSSTTHSLFRALEFGSDDGAITFQIAGIQWESKSSETTYTKTSRSNTQAILDLTNNNTVTADSLTYNADGTFSFNGSSNIINAGSGSSLSFTNAPFTLESIFKITAYQSGTYYGLTNMLIERGPASTYNYALQVSNATTIDFIKRTGAESLNNYGFTVPTLTNNISIVALTYNGSSSASLYHNGLLIGSVSVSNVAAAGGDILWIGGNVEARAKFTGNIYSTKIYNRALTATEVLQNFNAVRDRYGV